MEDKTVCIALRTVKYSDSSSIVTLWTRSRGRLSATIPSGATREATRRRALLMPLGVVEAVVKLKPGKEIATLADVRPVRGYEGLTASPVRGIVAMFLAEVLSVVLKESAPDDRISDFLLDSIRTLSELSGRALANFHIRFLFRLGALLGIEPDWGSYRRGYHLDLREGLFCQSAPTHRQAVDPQSAKLSLVIAGLSDEHLGMLRLDRDTRNGIVDRVLEYYTLHLTPTTSLRSLEVLREVFER